MKDIKKLENLKEQYNNIEITTELESIISTAIDKKPNILSVYFRKISVVAASIIVIFTSVVNISPAFAQSMSNIPVVNSIVKLVNFKTYTAKNGKALLADGTIAASTSNLYEEFRNVVSYGIPMKQAG